MGVICANQLTKQEWRLIDLFFLFYPNHFHEPFKPKSNQHLISPYNNTAESLTEIMRIKEMPDNLRSFDLHMNSPCQYQKKHVEKSMENMETDVGV